MKHMGVRQVSAGKVDAIVFLHSFRNPSRAECDEAIALLNRYATMGDFHRLRCLVVTDGGGPDAAQRGELEAIFKSQNHAMKTAVVTASVISRGIVAAVSWFNPNIRAFSPRHFRNALGHLDLPLSTESRLLRELSDIARELPPNSCLALITDAAVPATL